MLFILLCCIACPHILISSPRSFGYYDHKQVAAFCDNTSFGSGYVESGSPSVGSSRSWKSMEMEIQSLLEKLLDINDALSRCAATAAQTTSVSQKLARHRDILHEFTQVYFLVFQLLCHFTCPAFSSAFSSLYSSLRKEL